MYEIPLFIYLLFIGAGVHIVKITIEIITMVLQQIESNKRIRAINRKQG